MFFLQLCLRQSLPFSGPFLSQPGDWMTPGPAQDGVSQSPDHSVWVLVA